MLQPGWKEVCRPLLPGLLMPDPIPLDLQSTAKIFLRARKIDDHRQLAVRPVKGVIVPLEFLERPVAQDLQLLHIHDVELVVRRVYLVRHGGDIVVEPLEVGRLGQPAGMAGAVTALDVGPVLGQHRRPLHPDDLGIGNDHLALRAGQGFFDRDRREDLLLKRSLAFFSVHDSSPLAKFSNAFFIA